MKQPKERDTEPSPYESRSPTWAIVTWINEELRERIQRNGAALAEMHLARDEQLPVRSADRQIEDREAEP